MRLNILFFAFGIWLLQQQPVLPNLLYALIIFLLIALAFGLSRIHIIRIKLINSVLIKTIFLLAGFFWAAMFAHYRLADQLPEKWEGKDVLLTGVVASLPQQSDRGIRFTFDVEEIKTPDAIVPQHISLTWYSGSKQNDFSSLPEIHAGQRWQLMVRLKRPHGNANPHGFDYEAWMLENNLRATGYVRNDNQNQQLTVQVNRIDYLIERLREVIRERMQKSLEGKPYSGVLIALVIGDQRAIPSQQWQIFTRTGVSHLMSISGLHITMLSGLAFALMYWLWRRSMRLTLKLAAHKAASVFGLLVAVCYVALAGFAVPAQRTLYMLIVFAIGLWIARPGTASRVLCWALFIVLLIDPWAVISAGFWLSFGAVTFILFISQAHIIQPGWLINWAKVQWAITLGMVPLLLGLFQQVSIVSPLANAIAIPWISLIVVPLDFLCVIFPFDFMWPLTHELMRACMWVLTQLSNFPAAVWQQHAPPAWTVILGLLGTFWILLPRGFPARWLGVILISPMFLISPSVPLNGAFWATVLDVGQGLAVVVQTKNHALLYDAGPGFTPEADSGNRIIVPFLRASGIKHLNGMIITHDDSDHTGGANSVLQTVPVDWLASSLEDNHLLLGTIKNRMQCYAGQHWNWDNVKFEVLHPTLDSYQDFSTKDNERGCVLKISSANGELLLTADIEKKSEAALLNVFPEKLASTVLLVPHHGSKTSSTPEFIERVAPKQAVISVGYRNRFRHPNSEVVSRYIDKGIKIFRSDYDGALLIKFENNTSPKITGHRETYRRYWTTVPNTVESGVNF